MKRRSMLSLFAAPFLLNACSGENFYFLQMADTQLGMISGDEAGNDFKAETEIIEKLFARINAMKPAPAFVINCGDLTNLPGHERQIDEYFRLTGLLKPSIKFYNVSGNHDFKGKCKVDTMVFYHKTYGADQYSFESNGWHFLVLNSMLMKFPDSYPEAAESQLNWLKKDLAESAGKKGTLAFMHHPFFDNDIAEDDGYHNMPKEKRHEVLDIFAENNVKAIFSGHRHTTIPGHDYRGMKLINTNAICKSFDEKPGLRIVGVVDGAMRQEFVARDAIPEAVDVFAEGH